MRKVTDRTLGNQSKKKRIGGQSKICPLFFEIPPNSYMCINQLSELVKWSVVKGGEPDFYSHEMT